MCGRKQLISTHKLIDPPSAPPSKAKCNSMPIQMPGNMQIDREDIARTRQTQTQTKAAQWKAGRWRDREERQSDVQHMNCISCSVRLQGERGSRPGNLTFYFVHFVFRQCGKEIPLQICLGVLHYANIARARLLHCPCA